MFGRQFRKAEHRQHLPNPNTPGYTFELIGSIPRVAGQCSSCDGMGRETYETESGTLSTQTCTACGGTGVTASRRTANDWEAIQDKVQLSGWDPMYADYIAWALDNDKDVTDTYSIVDYSDLMGLDAEDEKDIKKFVNVTAPRLYSKRTAAGKCPKCDGMGRETYETDTGSLSTQTCKTCGGTGQAKESRRKQASSLTWGHETAEQSMLGQDAWFAYSGDGFNASVIEESPGSGRFTADIYTDSDLYKYLSTTEYGFESVDEAKSFVEGVFGHSRFSSRTANRRTAFLDTVELTEPRHRVAGWNWDDHLNGFIAAEAAREFTCSCGDSIPAPGYTDCRCGKRWNAYQIRANGSHKMIAREVPVRDGVVMAGRMAAYKGDDGYTREGRATINSGGWEVPSWVSNLDGWFMGDYAGLSAQVAKPGEYDVVEQKTWETYEYTVGGGLKTIEKGEAPSEDEAKRQAQAALEEWARKYEDWQRSTGNIAKSKQKVGDYLFDFLGGVPSIYSSLRGASRTASRKIAAPSSGADAIAQYFPGWIVDDDDGDFWEVQSPGREHAFIHEGNGVYTLLMNDNTPDEFWETGLSFNEALLEIQAEGII